MNSSCQITIITYKDEIFQSDAGNLPNPGKYIASKSVNSPFFHFIILLFELRYRYQLDYTILYNGDWTCFP